MVMSTYFLLLFIPYAASISFNFTEFTKHQFNDINIMGDAYIINNELQVTPNKIDLDVNETAGRATYVKPLHLWDNMSGELVSFTTEFSFVIDSNLVPHYGDGLTFFLAEDNYVVVAGAAMGLPIIPEDSFSKYLIKTPFVAVEFDTFPNRNWDPRDSNNTLIGDHVGINVNSLASVRYQKWFSNITGGGVCQALVTYDSVSKNLSVSLDGFQNNTVVHQVGLHHIIDLRDVFSDWVIFGFSAATGQDFQKNTVKYWNFNSSVLQIDNLKVPPPPPPKNPDPVKGQAISRSPNPVKAKSRSGLVVRLIVGLSVPITFVAVLAVCVLRKKKKRREEEHEFDVGMNNEFEMGTGPRKFSYRELARSTGDFAENEKLSEGGFGGVYRGFLKELSTHVAVKRVSKSSKQGIKEYASEVRIISRLRHRNLVQLTGWCHEKGELLLVYEFMENGSLDLHIFKEKSLLTWGTRYKIAHGLASALLYLHEEWEQCVLHRDIKSSNVMLDSSFNAKLGDFGLAKLVDHEKGSETTMLAGSLGYMAPECVVTGKASRESDVFSFGVVALEIVCGRKPIMYKAQSNQRRLVEWVWELYGTGSLLEAMDPRLGLDYEEEEIKRLMIVGLWCVHPDPDLCPLMRQVIQVLNSEASLPMLPSKMPVASYLSSPMSSLYGVNSIVQDQLSTSASNTGSSKQTT